MPNLFASVCKHCLQFLASLALLAHVAPSMARPGAPAQDAGPVLALVGATLYASPDSPALQDTVVLVRGGSIAAVGPRQRIKLPEGATVIDCHGLTMTAGFWNSHVHFMEKQWQDIDGQSAEQLTRELQAMLTSYGFTRAFDIAALDIAPLLRLRARIASGEVAGPQIYTVGVPMTPASPFYVAPLTLPVVHTVQQAQSHVRAQADRGADGIKLWSASPTGKEVVPMDPGIVRAAVAAAHARKLPVFAHPTDLAGAAIAVDGGVDILAHVAPEDRIDWPATLLKNMLAHHVALIPTLKLYQWDLERTGHRSATDPLLVTAVRQLGSYAAAGGTILFGTDVGFMDDYSPMAEYALMGQAGLSFRRILAALTTAPAAKFAPGQQVGKIAPGYAADLVLLSADPAADVTNFARVAYTIRAGRIIYRRAGP